MAEFAVAAQDLPTGYTKGDIIDVLPNGAVWGTKDGLPNMWQIAIPDIPYTLAKAYMVPLWSLAVIGDPEYDAPDEADRRIRRHRRPIRVMWDEVPAAWITTLETVGRIELTAADVRPYIRRLRWNRGKGQVQKTNNRAF